MSVPSNKNRISLTPKKTVRKWKEIFQTLLENQLHGRNAGRREHFGVCSEADAQLVFSERRDESHYIALALAQMTYVLESLENGDPRKWENNYTEYRTQRAFREWRQDVWWMFYQHDPYYQEPFSLESICAHLSETLRINLNPDAVRESCYRQGLCPPQSKIAVKKRCRKAHVHPLLQTGTAEPTARNARGLSKTRRWGSWCDKKVVADSDEKE